MEPIAIVGMACRVPGAASLGEFWKLLRDGRNSIDLIPSSRWDRERTFDPDPKTPGKINTRHGGFLEGIDLFDNQFFRVSPEEARQMDPQQRIMLELAYEAFADAGFSPGETKEMDAGVFIGVMSNDYLSRQTADEYRHIDRYTGCGSGYCMIANRISYQFNLRGPSLAIDSACSSSLVSTFMACESLWTHQCSLALAGGVNLILSPTLSMFYTRSGLSAPDGKCRTLSNDASGMGRGEGAGIVVLKRLSDAVRDGDNLYALIRGGAVNHNGRSNGMSAPSRLAQQSLLRKAYHHAGINTRDLQYVELHGTGTLIGDAIEATALGSVLAEGLAADDPCRIGSVKSNLGHLEGAAGVTGLIKLALSLSYRELVPSLGYKEPNPHVSFDTLPLKMQHRLEPWPDNGRPRLAGISSFGLGGANAHLVLEAAPEPVSTPASNPRSAPYILQLSTRSETALAQLKDRYLGYMRGLNDEDVLALCLTSLVRPQGHEHRSTFIARDRDDMIRQLSASVSATPSAGQFRGRYRELPRRSRVFIFPEFDAIDLPAARDLSKLHTCFVEALAECDRAIQEVLPGLAAPWLTDFSTGLAHQDARLLPFLQFGVQYAMSCLWRTAGFEPDAVVGAGMGQIAAWLAAGAIDLKSAVARIAAAHQLDLARTGRACLEQTGAFQIDCYSPLGKNLIQEHSRLLAQKPAGSRPLAELAEAPAWSEVDYFLQSLNPASSHLVGVADDSLVTAHSSQGFWRQLARLSVRHNILWKNFVTPSRLMRSPEYPWQHSRFWLESDQAPEAPRTQQESSDITRVVDGARGIVHAPESSGNRLAEDQHAAAENEPVPQGLDRTKLLGLPESERRTALAAYIKAQVAETLHLPADEMEEPQTFIGLGLDSLSALQLKNRVEAGLKVPVSLVKLLDRYSIGDLTTDLLAEGLPQGLSDPCSDPGFLNAASSEEHTSICEQPDDVTDMHDEDVDQMLRLLLAR
jgi:acyl transferase domain-containing protein